MLPLLRHPFALMAFAASAVLSPPPAQAQAGPADHPDSVVAGPAGVDAAQARVPADTLRPGPRVAPAGAAWRVPVPSGAALPQDNNRSLGAGSNVALMGVGAAGMVLGLLVGGDGGTMLSVGGGLVAFIGLFRYLR